MAITQTDDAPISKDWHYHPVLPIANSGVFAWSSASESRVKSGSRRPISSTIGTIREMGRYVL